jgi:hypothetical protein
LLNLGMRHVFWLAAGETQLTSTSRAVSSASTGDGGVAPIASRAGSESRVRSPDESQQQDSLDIDPRSTVQLPHSIHLDVMNTHRTLYQDHMLSCHVAASEGGAFRVQVAIVSLNGDKTRSQRFIDLPDHFDDKVSAIDRAIAAGMEWVDTNAYIIDRGFYVNRLVKRH